MAKMLKHLINPPLIHPEILEEVEDMETQNPLIKKIFFYWSTGLVKTDESVFKVPVFKGFKHLNIELRGSFGENVDIPEHFIFDNDDESSLHCSGGEIDCTATIKDFEVSEGIGGNFIIEYTEDHPGFAKLRIDKIEDINFWISHADIVSDTEGKNKIIYLSPEAFTDEWYFILLIRNTMMTYELEIVKQLSVNLSLDSIYVLTTQEGPAIKTTFLLKTGERYQVDTAIALKCLTWPKVATGWLTRKRDSNWPSDTLINSCVKEGCCFVPKCIEDSKTNLEWRLSFVAAESTLMKSLTKMQKASYRIFKGIWRIAFRAPAEKYIQSYHVKTVFLWYCETMKSESFSKELIVSRIFDLLHYLRKCLIEKNCPQYFIPDSNLFAAINKKVISKTLEHVNRAISTANRTWIYNRGLFILPSTTLTRVAMSMETTKKFLDSLNKLVKGSISFGVNSKQDEMKGKVATRSSDEMNILSMIKNDIKNCINEPDIESGTTSESSSDYDSDSGSITASDVFEAVMNDFLLSIGNTFTESYSENYDLDGDERLYLENLLFQVLSNNCDLAHSIFCYICSRIPPKELIQMEQRCKGSCQGMADAISYVGSCGLLLHSLTKFRKKGSVDYESEDKF